MSISNILSNITNTINKYCIGLTLTQPNYEKKIFDLESQNYVSIIEPNHDKQNILENNLKYIYKDNFDLDKYLVVGSGFDRTNGIEWKRTSIYSDYEVYYKGYHKIPYWQIERILFSNEIMKNFEFENILKTYIDCGKNFELTLAYLKL